MNNKKLGIIIAMLVLAIFAVGSVSAADNVTADIDVPTEDIAVDDVSVEEDIGSDDITSDESNKVINTRYSVNVAAGSSSSVIDAAINDVYTHGGGNVYFASGDYSNIAITLKSNVNLIGNNSNLAGDGENYVITVDNCNNIEITGFTINVGYNNINHTAAIRGSFVENANIHDNTMYGGYDGINLNKKCANIQVTDNNIYNMENDGVSLANPATMTTISNVGYSYISRNNISNCGYGIFIGGNFNGIIDNNNIDDTDVGMEFKGKPKNGNGNGTLIATLYKNTISNSGSGINMYHPGVQYLKLINMTFISNGDDILVNTNFNKTGFIGVYNCTFGIPDTVAPNFRSAVDEWLNNNI